MPQNSHIDPLTGAYHADPMWRRYQPQPSPPPGPIQLPRVQGPAPRLALPELLKAVEPPNEDDDINQRIDALTNDARQREDEYQSSLSPRTQASPVQALAGLQPGDNKWAGDRSAAFSPLDEAAVAENQGIAQGHSNQMMSRLAGRSAQEGRLTEMTRNRELASQPGSRMTTGATGADIAGLQSALTNDPDFGQAAQDRTAANEQTYQSAVSEGFRGTDPVGQAAQYGRRQAEEKMNLPLRQAEVAGQYGVKQQQEQSRGALDVAQEHTRGIMSAAEAKYQALQEFMKGRPIPAPGSGYSFNPSSGAISERAAPYEEVAPTISNQLGKAREALERTRGMAGGANEGFQNQVNTLIAAARAQLHAPPGIEEAVDRIMADPNLSKLPIETILKGFHPEGTPKGTPAAPEDARYLRELINIVRGF